jgi:hypothetical protein
MTLARMHQQVELNRRVIGKGGLRDDEKELIELCCVLEVEN